MDGFMEMVQDRCEQLRHVGYTNFFVSMYGSKFITSE